MNRATNAAAPVAEPVQQGALTLTVAGAAILALVLWSGTAVANKYALVEIDALTAGLLRSAMAAVCALGIALVCRFPFPRDWPTRLLLAYAGITSFAIWPAVLSLGLSRTSASHGALIMALLPVLTTLIAKTVDRQALRTGWIVGALVALGGTAWLVASQTEGGLDNAGASVAGDLIVLGGAAFCASGYVAGGKLTPKLGIWGATFWALALALSVQVPVLILLMPATDWNAVGATAWAGIGYMTVCSSLLGYALWFWALGAGGIARIGTWQFGQPVLAVILAALILFEPITWTLVAAAAIILAGTFLAQRFA